MMSRLKPVPCSIPMSGGCQDLSDELRRRRVEDVERFAGLLTTRDWHGKLGWKHHYLSWRVVVGRFTLGTGPGCDVHEKAIKGACSLRLPEGGINHDKAGGNTMSENSRLA